MVLGYSRMLFVCRKNCHLVSLVDNQGNCWLTGDPHHFGQSVSKTVLITLPAANRFHHRFPAKRVQIFMKSFIMTSQQSSKQFTMKEWQGITNLYCCHLLANLHLPFGVQGKGSHPIPRIRFFLNFS